MVSRLEATNQSMSRRSIASQPLVLGEDIPARTNLAHPGNDGQGLFDFQDSPSFSCQSCMFHGFGQ